MEKDIHVMPDYGREHVSRSDCWCRPVIDEDTKDSERYKALVWVHREEN